MIDEPQEESDVTTTFVRGPGPDKSRRLSPVGQFHDLCALFPSESFYREEASEGRIRIMPSTIRPVLRYWPVTMLLMIGSFLLIPVVNTRVDPAWAYMPRLNRAAVLSLIAAVVIWCSLVALLWRVGIFSTVKRLFKITLVYGVGIGLAVAVVLSAGLVWLRDPSKLRPNVVFASGFLFTAYVGGFLAYDLLIRAENMLEHLGKMEIVTDRYRYEYLFRTEISRQLNDRLLGVPVAYVFGGLFSLQLGLFWLGQDGPQQLGSSVALVWNVFFDAVLMTAIFQFVLLIKYINKVMDDRYVRSGMSVRLAIKPLHPDGQGGFRDIGRAATRVNLLVILAGSYYTYRLLVQGVRVLPTGGIGGLDTVAGVVWLIDFVAPIVLYAVVSLAWLYYSFWTIHRKMARDRERLLRERHTIETDSSIEDEDIGTYEQIAAAPVWPLDNRRLTTLVVTNAIPVVVTILSVT